MPSKFGQSVILKSRFRWILLGRRQAHPCHTSDRGLELAEEAAGRDVAKRHNSCVIRLGYTNLAVG
jgi:hypothetical protein